MKSRNASPSRLPLLRPFLALAASTQLAIADDINLSHEAVLCISNNSNSYIEMGTDPIIFIPEACPEVDLATAVAQFVSASGTFPQPDQEDAAVVAEIVALTRSEFDCLIERLQTASDGPFAISLELLCE